MDRFSNRFLWVLKNSPNLFQGYNLYVNRDKFRLIDKAFNSIGANASSFADLGGVWKVNAGYTRYTLNNYQIDKALIVDTDYPEVVKHKLSKYAQLSILQGDFTSLEQVENVGEVDLIYLFDVLLHQANPNWDDVLTSYANNTKCFVIFNQQFIQGNESIRLTDLSLDEYIKLAPQGREEVLREIFANKSKIHPKFGKPWIDIHNIFQWGITDTSLREFMNNLGFSEEYYQNYGKFSNSSYFENHGFIFKKSIN